MSRISERARGKLCLGVGVDSGETPEGGLSRLPPGGPEATMADGRQASFGFSYQC